MKALKIVREQVEYILEYYPDTRNSDKYLTWKVWTMFFGVNEMIDYNKFVTLPSEDNIKRYRADIQNKEKRFIPTIWEIAEKREWLADEWKRLLGYWVGNENQLEMFSLGKRKVHGGF